LTNAYPASNIKVVSAFHDFSFGKSPIGIYGALPIDTHHAWLLRLMEHVLERVYSHVSPRKAITIWIDRRYKGDTRGGMSQVKLMEY
jgi:hypothetical protein